MSLYPNDIASQNIEIQGDCTGHGTTLVLLTMNAVNSAPGTYQGMTVNAKGLVTSCSNMSYLTSGAPTAQSFVATLLQRTFNTTVNTVAASGGKSFLLVFANGVYQREGTDFTVTGPNQIVFTAGLSLNLVVNILSWS